uniref:RRM domain-containing protein n=1 Tax=Mola mola TaxID=94237 RepID=A0A3Q3WUL7_MOLML
MSGVVIYVGNLPSDIRMKDLENVFYTYGTIWDIDPKNRRGGGPFAFINSKIMRSMGEIHAMTSKIFGFAALTKLFHIITRCLC